jgi:hypothetical protein
MTSSYLPDQTPEYIIKYISGPNLGSRAQKPWPNKTLYFSPERDTVFLRPLDYQPNELWDFISKIDYINTIQHLALPLEQQGVPSRKKMHDILAAMSALKTLTFMIGSKEKSWRGTQRGVELRDVEQWFVDGRSRDVFRGNGGMIDVKDVESFYARPFGMRSHINVPRPRMWNRVINVRVVAWKRGGRC